MPSLPRTSVQPGSTKDSIKTFTLIYTSSGNHYTPRILIRERKTGGYGSTSFTSESFGYDSEDSDSDSNDGSGDDNDNNNDLTLGGWDIDTALAFDEASQSNKAKQLVLQRQNSYSSSSVQSWSTKVFKSKNISQVIDFPIETLKSAVAQIKTADRDPFITSGILSKRGGSSSSSSSISNASSSTSPSPSTTSLFSSIPIPSLPFTTSSSSSSSSSTISPSSPSSSLRKNDGFSSRYFISLGSYLFYFKSQSDTTNLLSSPLGCIPLQNAVIQIPLKGARSFKANSSNDSMRDALYEFCVKDVSGKRRTFYLATASVHERDGWVNNLKTRVLLSKGRETTLSSSSNVYNPSIITSSDENQSADAASKRSKIKLLSSNAANKVGTTTKLGYDIAKNKVTSKVKIITDTKVGQTVGKGLRGVKDAAVKGGSKFARQASSTLQSSSSSSAMNNNNNSSSDIASSNTINIETNTVIYSSGSDLQTHDILTQFSQPNFDPNTYVSTFYTRHSSLESPPLQNRLLDAQRAGKEALASLVFQEYGNFIKAGEMVKEVRLGVCDVKEKIKMLEVGVGNVNVLGDVRELLGEEESESDDEEESGSDDCDGDESSIDEDESDDEDEKNGRGSGSMNGLEDEAEEADENGNDNDDFDGIISPLSSENLREKEKERENEETPLPLWIKSNIQQITSSLTTYDYFSATTLLLTTRSFLISIIKDRKNRDKSSKGRAFKEVDKHLRHLKKVEHGIVNGVKDGIEVRLERFHKTVPLKKQSQFVTPLNLSPPIQVYQNLQILVLLGYPEDAVECFIGLRGRYCEVVLEGWVGGLMVENEGEEAGSGEVREKWMKMFLSRFAAGFFKALHGEIKEFLKLFDNSDKDEINDFEGKEKEKHHQHQSKAEAMTSLIIYVETLIEKFVTSIKPCLILGGGAYRKEVLKILVGESRRWIDEVGIPCSAKVRKLVRAVN